ncbi:MAG: alpha/beta hydrolase-fold protein [Saprospiraceae bacterium]|nr:alpha/beta hydrolase-fold protein [Saprospiraceae bacterium]
MLFVYFYSVLSGIFLNFFSPISAPPLRTLNFEVGLGSTINQNNLQGRLLLILSKDTIGEPRFQVNDGLRSQQIFGLDVNHWQQPNKIKLNEAIVGYPLASLKDVPPGTYRAQAVLHVYETVQLQTGQTIKVPMDRGEGQHWNQAPGNLYSIPVKIDIKNSGTQLFKINLNQTIPPIEQPADTKYIKHIKIQSKLLSAFWGRPMFLGAHVLLPEGFDQHPEARYPLAIFHGHFPDDFGGFRTHPPDSTLKPDYNERFNLKGYNIIQQQEAYDFYKIWTGPGFPRVLAIEIQHPTPYYDDSYAVNSASQGPWGDAITYELIPYIEKKFQGIGEGWARFTYGGSTGGWEALAVQVFYPDQYNGCYAACPDPIDFRAYCLINLYEDPNAYYYEGNFKNMLRPGTRNYLGQLGTTVRDMNMRELVLGTHSRSGEQWDIWEATYSPQAKDGYPEHLFDKQTGVINKKVAEYWKENYDLSYILKRDWKKYGHQWKGRIHLYCGDMDNYYLNNAVYLTEEFLKTTTEPYYDGEVEYGDRAEHCWNGDQTQPNAISRLRYHRYFIPKWTAEVQQRAPLNADLKSWRY